MHELDAFGALPMQAQANRLGHFVHRGWLRARRGPGGLNLYTIGPSRSWTAPRMHSSNKDPLPPLEAAIRVLAYRLALEAERDLSPEDNADRVTAQQGAMEFAVDLLCDALDADDRLLVASAKVERRVRKGVPA